jgi:hypothetical protein
LNVPYSIFVYICFDSENHFLAADNDGVIETKYFIALSANVVHVNSLQRCDRPNLQHP